MSSNDLEKALQSVVGEEQVHAEGNHYHVSPGNALEVSRLAVLANKHKAVLIPVGVGRRSTPTDDLRPQLLLNLMRMNHVLHLDHKSLIAHRMD
jgi:FAD/FMN-containing dehydrogenase